MYIRNLRHAGNRTIFYGWSKYKATELFNGDNKSFEKQITLLIEQRSPGRSNAFNPQEI